MDKVALFPGSFDPFTVGHEAVVRRLARLFDRIVVAVGVNSDKKYMFTVEQREDRIRVMLKDVENVEVTHYDDMTVECCKRWGASYIVRGVRNVKDMEYEQQVAAVNRTMAPEIETVIIFANADMVDVSSTIEREKMTHRT